VPARVDVEAAAAAQILVDRVNVDGRQDSQDTQLSGSEHHELSIAVVENRPIRD
jgi:hypothetical protein